MPRIPGKNARLIAEETARLVLDEGETDYVWARKRAARRLGLKDPSDLPAMSDVELAISSRRGLFGGQVDQAWRHQLRLSALKLLDVFAAFSARLVGQLVADIVTPGTRIELHVFSDDAKYVAIELLNHEIHYQAVDRTFGSSTTVPGFQFDWGEIPVELLVFQSDALRRAPQDPLTGKPMKRIDSDEAAALFGQDR